jgi:hypothetical protein
VGRNDGLKKETNEIDCTIQAIREGWIGSLPRQNALQRARRAYKRNLEDPGDCDGDIPLLAGLAIAQADVGMRPGWIPEVQRIGVAIAKLAEQPI